MCPKNKKYAVIFKDEMIATRIFLDIVEEKNKDKLDDGTLMKTLESNIFHKDNIHTLERLFKKHKVKGKNKKKLLELLGSGKHPHKKPLDAKTLKSLGIDVEVGIPKEIDKMFQSYIKIRKHIKNNNNN